MKRSVSSNGAGAEGPTRTRFGFQQSSWRRARREGAWVLAAQVSVALAGMAGARILTELAPRTVFGQATLLLGAMGLGRTFFVAPITNAQIRFHPEFQSAHRLNWFTRQISRYAWMASALLAVVTLIAYTIWRGLIKSNDFRPMLAILMIAMIGIDTAKSLRSNALMADRRQARLAFWQSAEAWLVLALTAVALWFSQTAEAYLTAMALASLASCIAFGILWYPSLVPDRQDDLPSSQTQFIRKILAYGLPFIPLALVGWVSNVGDRYLLGALTDTSNVGFYAVVYGLASRPFLMASGIFGSFARPILFHAESAGERTKARKIFRLWIAGVTLTGIAGVVAFWLLGKWVVWLFLAREYREGATAILVWVSVGYALIMVVQTVENRLLSMTHSKTLIVPSTLAAIANIILNLVLIPRLGVIGAAQATAGSFAVHLTLIFFALARVNTHRNSVVTDKGNPKT